MTRENMIGLWNAW